MSDISFLNLQYFFLQIHKLFTGENTDSLPDSFDTFWSNFQSVSAIVSLLLLVGIVYSIIRIRQIRKEEKEIYGEVLAPQTAEARRDERWEKVLGHIESENPSDWRLAILEADVLLDEVVSRMGYDGEGLGEKLKQIERSDFSTLDQAWEAHKVRNTIAHEGSDFILTQRKARQVIDLYRQVFEEFRFV